MKHQMQSFNAECRNPLIIIELLSEHILRKPRFRLQIRVPANLMFRPQSLHRLSSKQHNWHAQDKQNKIHISVEKLHANISRKFAGGLSFAKMELHWFVKGPKSLTVHNFSTQGKGWMWRLFPWLGCERSTNVFFFFSSLDKFLMLLLGALNFSAHCFFVQC